MAKLMVPVGEPLARYQPTLRYFLLDEGACQDDDLPRGNLVTALIGFENSRSPEALGRMASALPEWLRGPGEPELKRAFLQWALRGGHAGRWPVGGPVADTAAIGGGSDDAG